MNTASWSELSAAIAANPTAHVGLKTGETASGSIAIMPEETADLTWLPGWKEDTTFTISDAVSLSLWVRDPLYRTAAESLRRAMEMEEASALIDMLETAWKEYGGRGRGWVRKHLEEDLRPRAGGADPMPNAFEVVRTSKRAALLLDYICIVRKLRVGIWWTATDPQSTTIIPVSAPTTDIVIQLSAAGHVLLGPRGWQTSAREWNRLAATRWVPAACSPSIGAQTVAEIKEQLVAVGVEPAGGRQTLWNHLQWALLCRDIETGPTGAKI